MSDDNKEVLAHGDNKIVKLTPDEYNYLQKCIHKDIYTKIYPCSFLAGTIAFISLRFGYMKPSYSLLKISAAFFMGGFLARLSTIQKCSQEILQRKELALTQDVPPSSEQAPPFSSFGMTNVAEQRAMQPDNYNNERVKKAYTTYKEIGNERMHKMLKDRREELSSSKISERRGATNESSDQFNNFPSQDSSLNSPAKKYPFNDQIPVSGDIPSQAPPRVNKYGDVL